MQVSRALLAEYLAVQKKKKPFKGLGLEHQFHNLVICYFQSVDLCHFVRLLVENFQYREAITCVIFVCCTFRFFRTLQLFFKFGIMLVIAYFK